MKKILLMMLLQSTMLAFAQDKEYMPTVREVIFGAPLNEKSKVEQISKDGTRKRVLTKIGTKKETKMNRYLMEEMDLKGLPVLSFNILSRAEIAKDEDFFKFSVSEYEMIFLDPVVQKAKAATEQSKKTIRVVPKLNEKPVDLNTVPQPDDYLADPCAGGRGLCLVWWLEYYEGGDLVGSELISVDCYCNQPGGGGGIGGGSGGGAEPPTSTSCDQQSEQFANQGSAMAGPLDESGGELNGDVWNKSYNWKIFSALTWGLLSYEKAKCVRVQYQYKRLWEFESFVHERIAEIGANFGGTRTFQDIGNTINITSARTSAWVRIDFSVTSAASIPPPFNIVCPPVVLTYNANKKFFAPNEFVIVN